MPFISEKFTFSLRWNISEAGPMLRYSDKEISIYHHLLISSIIHQLSKFIENLEMLLGGRGIFAENWCYLIETGSSDTTTISKPKEIQAKRNSKYQDFC